MNNNIQESYCSFEVSKLLKEKGLDCGTHTTAYSEDGIKQISPYSSFYDPYKYPILNCTHSLAIEWIRVNFGIEIYFRPERNCRIGVTTYYYGISKISKTNHLEIIEVVDLLNSEYSTPQEAIEAALIYTLKNLI